MRKVTQKQFVQKMLDSIFSTVKHANQVEREVCFLVCEFRCDVYSIINVCLHKLFAQTELCATCVRVRSTHFMQGCAIGVGFCAASHLDLAVSKLEQVMKEEMVRKSKGFFGFSKVYTMYA